MTGTPRRSAPYPERVLMYRKGLSRGQIADLTGAAAATVGYHLGLARTQDLGLQSEHETAVRKPAVTGQGRERMGQLVAFVQDTGRYPSKSSHAAERTLAEWLQRRRREAADGTLAPAYRQGLAVLPGWRGTSPLPPAGLPSEYRGAERLRPCGSELSLTSQEHELGVGLHTQRFRQRRAACSAEPEPDAELMLFAALLRSFPRAAGSPSLRCGRLSGLSACPAISFGRRRSGGSFPARKDAESFLVSRGEGPCMCVRSHTPSQCLFQCGGQPTAAPCDENSGLEQPFSVGCRRQG